MLKLKGNMFEIGTFEDGSGQGFRIEDVDGVVVSISGLTEEHCRAVATLFYEEVEITISGVTPNKI